MKKRYFQLAELVDARYPEAVLEEVKYNFIQYYPIGDFRVIRKAFSDFKTLFKGGYPGYKACSTKFHDELHTSDALLAISRLIDGYNLANTFTLPAHDVKIALISTLFHDSGYIQKKDERTGTGARYTLIHVERSIEFLKDYLKKLGLSRKDFLSSRNMIMCTGLDVATEKIKFSCGTEKVLGYMIGTADYLGQMSSRTYLERLYHLYKEFREGKIQGFDSVYTLYKKTPSFCSYILGLLKNKYGDVSRYARFHFRERYCIDTNLYIDTIKREMSYLNKILVNRTYNMKLRRKD